MKSIHSRGIVILLTVNHGAQNTFVRGRVIDLSRAAADVIGMRSAGLAPVSIQI